MDGHYTEATTHNAWPGWIALNFGQNNISEFEIAIVL
jgi:hypothetical protein